MGICLSTQQYQINELMNKTKDVDLFNFNGIDTIAKVVYVYDGDTVHIVIPYKKEYIKLKCRLLGIDTPELRVAEQKEKGLIAKKRLIEILEESKYIVKVKCHNFDKYGRVLITLFTLNNNNTSINQTLINEGHAYEYDGGTKKNITNIMYI